MSLPTATQAAPDAAASRQSEPRPLEQPQSCHDLFVSFSKLALQGFGGVLAVAQRELVEKKRWYTKEGFVEDWAVAQILPGPNVVNLALMIGDRYFGIAGAAAAICGMLFFPMLLVLLLAALFSGVADVPAVQGALRGMGAVAAGLITATGLKLTDALRANVLSRLACWFFAVLTFAGVAILRLPLAWVLLGVGGVACLWAYRQLVIARGAAA